MASTRNIQASIMFAAPILRFQPLAIAGLEPATTAANIVLQTVLGAPFTWPWNRSTFLGTLTVNNQDVSVDVEDFGFLEKANVVDEASKPWECEVKRVLARDSSPSSRPKYVSNFIENGDGTFVFRVMPPPDEAYELYGIYQKAAPQITSPASLWSPIPDRYGYIVDWLFLGLMAVLLNDARWPQFNQKGIAHLLGAQQGLSETEKNIFVEGYAQMLMQLQGVGIKTTQGNQARTV